MQTFNPTENQQPNPTENQKPNTPKTKTTIEQQIAQKQDQLAKLKLKHETEQNGIKYVLGGLLQNKAKSNKQTAQTVLAWIEQDVTRPADKARLEKLIIELKQITNT